MKSGQIKAIETRYAGYKFRSRLEARWAVFFDALGAQWEYEKEGFELGNGVRYLPDFWLPIVGAQPYPMGLPPTPGYWVEVKPCALSRDETNKLRKLASMTGHHAYAFVGDVWLGEFAIYHANCNTHGLRVYTPDLCPNCMGAKYDQRLRGDSPQWRGIDTYAREIQICILCDGIGYTGPMLFLFGVLLSFFENLCPAKCLVPVVTSAFQAARSARFEHGERGK